MATIYLFLFTEKSGSGSNSDGYYDDDSSLSYRWKSNSKAVAPVLLLYSTSMSRCVNNSSLIHLKITSDRQIAAPTHC